ARQTDPADQRARTLHLTASGRALASRLRPLLDEVRAHLLADVSDADLAVCARRWRATMRAACTRHAARRRAMSDATAVLELPADEEPTAILTRVDVPVHRGAEHKYIIAFAVVLAALM